MLNIDEQISIEGRVTEFQMQYIKSRFLGQTNSSQHFIGSKMQKLKAEQIKFLTQKVKQMQSLQLKTAYIYAQEVYQLEKAVEQKQQEINIVREEIKKIKTDFMELTRDTNFIQNYMNPKAEVKRVFGSPKKQQKIELQYPVRKLIKKSTQLPQKSHETSHKKQPDRHQTQRPQSGKNRSPQQKSKPLVRTLQKK